VQAAGAADLIQLAPQFGHPVTDHPAVGLDLRLAGATSVPDATALSLQVRPTTHQSCGKVFEPG